VTLYDISGSAAWFNKPDHGIILHRPGALRSMEVFVDKVRMEGTGKIGSTKLEWSKDWQRYVSDE
jgi:twinkle protein